MAAGSVSIALAASSLAAAAVTSQAIVAQTVDAGWRGAYDLLVQPADADALMVNGLQIVPDDFLSVRSTGITRDQWQLILTIPDVEVAAPLATLGWLRPDAADVSATFGMPGPGELIRIDAELVDAEGTAQRSAGYMGFDFSDPEQPSDVVDTFPSGGFGFGVADVILDLTLPAGWGSVVGIDPIEEDGLVGLGSYVEGSLLQRGLTTTFDPAYGVTAIQVPVITPSHSSWPGQLTMTMTKISGVDVAAIADTLGQTPGGYRDIELIEQLTQGAQARLIATQTAALDDLVQPLWDAHVSFRDGDLVGGEEGGASSIGRNVLLLAGETSYGVDGHGLLALDSLGTWGTLVKPDIAAAQPDNFSPEFSSLDEMLQYRPISVTVPDPFLVRALGTYDLQAIGVRYAEVSNYVPLGVYGEPTRHLIADASGRPVETPLPISLNPGGLNPLPPIGLTNLETVEALRGLQFIDAIRVRVADITAYTPEAVDRIARVAAAIHDRTGLHVDVVAGSSPVDVDVAVAGVGTVRERWTTLGEAPRIVSGAEGLSGLLLAGAGLVVVLYLGSFGVFLVDDQRRGMTILRQVGWRRMSRTWLLVSQALLLGSASAILSVVLLGIFDAATEVHVSLAGHGVTALVVVSAHMTAAGLAALTGAKRRETSFVEPGRWLSLGVIRFGLRNSLEAPRRQVTVLVALAVAITIAGTIAVVETAYGGELRTTILGGLIWLRVGWYHLLAAGAALFAAASIALDSGVLAVERRVGLIALLRATGWRARAIAAVVIVEVGLPALVGGLIAVVPVVALGVWAGFTVGGLIIMASAAVGLGTLVAVLVAALPTRLALSVEPALGLVAEDLSGALPGFASRAALVTVLILALFVSAVGVGYGVLAPVAIPNDAFVPVPTVRPPSDDLLALAAHVELIAAHPNRQYGSDSLEWTLSYITDVLSSNGGSTSEQDFVSYEVTWFDAAKDPLEIGGLAGLGVAVTSGFAADVPGPFTVLAGPESPCATGLVVVRVPGAGVPTLPFDTLSRCAPSGTTAVLAVRATNDEAWAAISVAATVKLTGGKVLWATVGTPNEHTPVLVVPVGSTGPGAAQSAAPIAVAVELAAWANERHLPLRMVFVDLNQRGMLAVVARQVAELAPVGPIIELGSLGGTLAAVLGVRWVEPLDEASARSTLIGTILFDEGADAWFERTGQLMANDSSEALLTAIVDATAPEDVRFEGVVAPAVLTVGVDAVYYGEPLTNNTDTGSPADTADQLDGSALEHTLERLRRALEVIHAR